MRRLGSNRGLLDVDLDAEEVGLDALLAADPARMWAAKRAARGGGGAAAGAATESKTARGDGDAVAAIEALRAAVADDAVPAYGAAFDSAAAAEEVVIGFVSEAELAAREAAIAAAREAAAAEEARRFAAKEALLLRKEAAAKARVLADKADLAARIKRRQAETADAAEARTAALHRTFRRAEVELKSNLAAQHALVSEKYGRLVPGRAGARQMRIEWHKLPQPVEIRISRIRAVKKKLFRGRFVMLVTLYDRLGGNPMRWTRVALGGGGGDASRPGATTPVRHRGRFFDTEITFNQCVYAVAPSASDLRPAHVFIFELFQLGDRRNPIDRVVAWTALPACDRDFQVVWGRFKLPLMRGEVDLAVDKYRTLEAKIEADLDDWLANVYLEVVHLPRETVRDGATLREFDVEIAYTSELLRVRGEYRTPKRWGAGVRLANGALRRRGGGAAGGAGTGGGGLSAVAEGTHEDGGADDDDEHGGGGGGGDDGGSEGEEDDDIGDMDSDGNPVDNDDLGLDLGWDDEDADAMDDMLLGIAMGDTQVREAGDWNDAADVEAEDGFAGGPPIVSDRVTREDVMALGAVGERATIPNGGALHGKAAGLAARATGVTPITAIAAHGGGGGAARGGGAGVAARGGGAGGGAGGGSGSDSARGRGGTAKSQADYWRARAAETKAGGGGGGGGSGSPAVGIASDSSAGDASPMGAGTGLGVRGAGPGTTGASYYANRRRAADALLLGAEDGVDAYVEEEDDGEGGWGVDGGGSSRFLLKPPPPGASGSDSARGGGGDSARGGGGGSGGGGGGDSARGGGGGGGEARLGAAFVAEAGRVRNMFRQLGPPAPPQAGALVGTAVRASVPGAAGGGSGGGAAAQGGSGGLSSYSYAMNKQEGKGLRGARVRESVRKARFLQYELVADLHPGSVFTFDFWIQFVLLLIALWLRIYIHYLGQWLFLRSLRIPVYEFSPQVYTATLKYVSDVLPNEVEIGVVVIGPIAVLVVFSVFMGFSWACQRLVGFFPEIPSRFVAFFGFAGVLDAVLITVVDAAAGRYDCASRQAICGTNVASPECTCSEGDAWKLYNRFTAQEGSGVVGIVLTVFMYLVVMVLAAFLLYAYLLHLHLNGRMIDLFRRLHAEEPKFALPHDFEVSPAELREVVSRAQRWRGARGATRKIAVCDYKLLDPLDRSFEASTTHLIVYNAALDGQRELYRHFLRLPDGAILEVFGSMERQLGMAAGMGTSTLQGLLMSHGRDGGANDGSAVNAFFAGL